MAWWGLAATLIWNYVNHRRHKPTICSVTRQLLPPWAFLLGWTAFNRFMIPHIWRGYPRPLKES